MTTMRPLVRRALERAGLLELGGRALAGAPLGAADLALLRTADVLAVAALADLVREQRQGDAVTLIDLGDAPDTALEGLAFARPDLGATDGATGLEALREVALVRLGTPAERAVAVSFDALGEGLAQAALTFGASVLVGTMTRPALPLHDRPALPLLDDAATRTKKAELLGRVERAGRRAHWGVTP